ncbi:hypothetical protein [Yoonia sp.]|uniref:hypothetical protein n=1 Tax=Yoonia sp. TaxID=2212373 RepID=UPI004047E7C2
MANYSDPPRIERLNPVMVDAGDKCLAKERDEIAVQRCDVILEHLAPCARIQLPLHINNGQFRHILKAFSYHGQIVFGAKPTKLVNPSDSELFSNFDLPDQLQPKAGEQFSLALVRKNADGTGSIVFGTDNVAAVTSVLALAGKSLQDNAAKAAEVDAAKQVAAVKQQNVAELNAVMAETLTTKQPMFKPQLTVSDAVAVPA